MAIDLKAYEAVIDKQAAEEKTAGRIGELLSRDIRLFGNGIPDKTKEQFYAQLYLLLSAGVDMKSALELFEQTRKKRTEKQVFGALRERVVSGSSLSGALEKSGDLFSEYERFGIMIGEESGRLAEVLNEQSVFFAKKIKQ